MSEMDVLEARHATRAATRAAEAAKTAAVLATGTEADLKKEIKALEWRVNYNSGEVYRLERALTTANLMLKEKEGAVKYFPPGDKAIYSEWPRLRQMLKRWDERNWVDLCLYALRGARDDAGEIDYTFDIEDSRPFKACATGA